MEEERKKSSSSHPGGNSGESMTKDSHESGSNDTSAIGFSASWSRLVNSIHTPILHVLHHVTQLVAYNPKRTLSIVTTVSLLLLVLGLFTNFTVDVDEDKLWTPSNSLPIQHSDWIDEASNYPPDTLDLILFFHADGDNVLGQDEVTQVFEAFDTVLEIPNYETVCADSTYIDAETNQPTCEVDGIVQFWKLDSTLYETEISSDEEAIAALSERTFPDGTKVSQNAVFGNPQRNPNTDQLTNCQGYTVRIRLPDTEAAESWEDDALDVLLDLRDEWNGNPNRPLQLEVTAAGSFGDEYVSSRQQRRHGSRSLYLPTLC